MSYIVALVQVHGEIEWSSEIHEQSLLGGNIINGEPSRAEPALVDANDSWLSSPPLPDDGEAAAATSSQPASVGPRRRGWPAAPPSRRRVWMRAWRDRSSLREKLRPHIVQANGLSPVWVRWWVVRWSDRLNDLPHVEHVNGF